MSDVQFKENYYGSDSNFNNQDKNNKIIQFLLDKGIAQDEEQANYIVFGIVILIIIISVFIFIKGTGGNKPQSGEIPPDQFIAQ